MSDLIMTVDDLAKYLRMKKVTIYKHAQLNRFPSFKVGSSWRFRQSAIDKWIEDQEMKNDTAVQRVLNKVSK